MSGGKRIDVKRMARDLKPVPYRIIVPPQFKSEREYMDAIVRGEVSDMMTIQLLPEPPQ